MASWIKRNIRNPEVLAMLDPHLDLARVAREHGIASCPMAQRPTAPPDAALAPALSEEPPSASPALVRAIIALCAIDQLPVAQQQAARDAWNAKYQDVDLLMVSRVHGDRRATAMLEDAVAKAQEAGACATATPHAP